MSIIERDMSCFPLVLERYPADFTNDDLQNFVEKSLHDPLLTSRTWASVAVIESTMKMMDPAQAKIWESFIRDSQEYMAKYCVGAAVVARTPLIRGMLNFVLTRGSTPMPVKMFASEPEACQWAVTQLENHLGSRYRHQYRRALGS